MDKVSFLKVVIAARTLQLYYHYCHNLSTGSTFMQDHEEFKTNYTQAEADYDVVVEYMIANLGNESFDTKTINQVLAGVLSSYQIESMTADKMFEIALKLEKDYQQVVANLEKNASLGLKNALGDVAQASDVRIYKIQQRLKQKTPGIQNI